MYLLTGIVYVGGLKTGYSVALLYETKQGATEESWSEKKG
jgi:hypothetical protein